MGSDIFELVALGAIVVLQAGPDPGRNKPFYGRIAQQQESFESVPIDFGKSWAGTSELLSAPTQ